MSDPESKLNSKTPDVSAAAEEKESVLAETPAEISPPVGTESSALQNSLRDLSQGLQTAASAFRAAINPLLDALQKSGELLTKWNAPNNPPASTESTAPAQLLPDATPTVPADSAPTESLADSEPPSSANPSQGDTSPELARQLAAIRQNDESDQTALLKAFQEFHTVSAANTQKLIAQVQLAAAQQQQLQGQIDALKSALQQQAGQNANRNLNTGT